MTEEGGSEGENQRTQCQKQPISSAGRRQRLGRACIREALARVGQPLVGRLGSMVGAPDRHRGPPWMSSELPKEDHRGNV